MFRQKTPLASSNANPNAEDADAASAPRSGAYDAWLKHTKESLRKEKNLDDKVSSLNAAYYDSMKIRDSKDWMHATLPNTKVPGARHTKLSPRVPHSWTRGGTSHDDSGGGTPAHQGAPTLEQQLLDRQQSAKSKNPPTIGDLEKMDVTHQIDALHAMGESKQFPTAF